MSVARLSPRSVRLALFAVLCPLLLNGVLVAAGQPSTWDELRLFASGTQGVDSWRPMNQARAYLDLEPTRPLYSWLFFEKRVKFIYPPTSLLLFDVLPRESLRSALNVLSWLLVLATVGFSVAIFDRELQRSRFAASGPVDRGVRVAAATVLALCFYPMLKAYTLGQMQVLVNAMFAACLWCTLAQRKATAGVLVALMTAVKPQYGVILLWGLLRREWRFAAATALAGLSLLGVSVLRFGWQHHWDYLSVLAYVSRHGEAYWLNQTPNGFLHRLLGNGVSSHWDPHVYPPYDAAVHAGTLLAAVVLLGAALFGRTSARRRGGALDLAAVALAATIASPIAWEHHYGVLLPIFALLLPRALGAPRAGVAVTLLAAGYAVAGGRWQLLGRLSGTPWNPLQSLLLFVALGLLGVLLWLRVGQGRLTDPRCADAPPV